jgi:hypothetical protein
MKNLSHEYKRRDPEETILYKVLEEHAQSFFDMTASDPDRKPLPNFVKREFDKFLSCGVLSEGFVRVKCDDCTQSSVAEFSCKRRGFCPSCAGRRMSERAFNLSDQIIPYVPTRHWVLSLLFELRYWMASDDKLLKQINQILCDEINNYLRKKARGRGICGWGETGIVSFLQRAGSSLNLNLHFHLLVLDGIYAMSDDGHPIFHRIPGIKDEELSTVMNGISRRAIKYLRKIGKLPAEGEEVLIVDEAADQNMAHSHIKLASISSRIALGPRAGLKVRRTGSSFGYEEEIPKTGVYGCVTMNGFSLHAATSIKAHERDRLEQLLRYLGRGPVSSGNISLDKDGNVLYELKKSYNGAMHVLFSPMEFIEKLASIVPPVYKHQVNYYGCLSSNSHVRPLIIASALAAATGDLVDAAEVSAEAASSPSQKTEDDKAAAEKRKKANYIPWAELLKRTFGFDLTVCSCCGGRVRVITAITSKEAIQRILGHMGLSTGPPKSQGSYETEYVYV